MLHQIRRFASLALLVAAGALVFGACDSDTAKDPVESENDALQIKSITPAPGNTVTPGDDTTWTITFDASVADNFYTQAASQQEDASDVRSDETRLVDAISITPTAKELTPGGGIPKEISWNDNRDELTIDPLLSLEDGTIYKVDLSGLFDSGFVDEDGNQLLEGETLANSKIITAHAAENTDAPSAPTVSFDSDEGEIDDDGSINDETYNYTNEDISIPLEIENVDPDGDDVKGYEVYYTTNSFDDFQKVETSDILVRGTPLGNVSEGFEADNGIIPAYFVNEVQGDVIEFSVSTPSELYPFEDGPAEYGPVELKVRAVSINNVRSGFTTTSTDAGVGDLQVDDNSDPDFTSIDADPGADEITVFLDEPVDASTVGTGDFEVDADTDGDFDQDDVTVNSTSVTNIRASGDETSRIVLQTENFTDNTNVEADYNVSTGSSIDDLAGNVQDSDAFRTDSTP